MWPYSLEVVLQNNKLSSAKNKWISLDPFREVGTPKSHPELSAWVRRELRASAYMIKR
jgi:hypothetical protein